LDGPLSDILSVVLATASTIVRLSLHVLAATFWVGGQFTLAGVVPTLRQGGSVVVAAAARRFAQMAWPAYVVLLGTGVWNVVVVDPSKQSVAWRVVLTVKIVIVVLSGFSAWMHQRSKTTQSLAFWGAMSGLTATTALVLGVALAG
jgi:putative copper export protein